MDQTRLDKPVGTLEPEKLDAKSVTVKSLDIVVPASLSAGKKISEIVEVMVKHPSSDDLIKISKVAFIKDGKVKVVGLWYNEDKEGNIAKGSALSIFLESASCKSLRELINKEIPTMKGEQGYLAFKAY